MLQYYYSSSFAMTISNTDHREPDLFVDEYIIKGGQANIFSLVFHKSLAGANKLIETHCNFCHPPTLIATDLAANDGLEVLIRAFFFNLIPPLLSIGLPLDK